MSLIGHFITLAIFSLSLAAVISGYRDDDPKQILKGIPRRAGLFGGAVLALAWLSWLFGISFLAV